MNLKEAIRTIENFPKPGISFKDITTLLVDPKVLKEAIEGMAAPFEGKGVSKVVAIESRGFIFGMPIALKLGVGFVPIRKPGKLPSEVLSQSYQLEYGSDSIEIHKDALVPGEKILLVDDLLATGGTMKAALALVKRLKAEVLGISFLIELEFLKGRETLPGGLIHSLVKY